MSLSNFSLAVNSSRKVAGQWRQRTDWVPCTAFYENIVEKVSSADAKGKLCYIEGHMRVDESGQGAERKVYVKVVVDKLQVLDAHGIIPQPVREHGIAREGETVEVEGAEPVREDDETPF